MQAMVFLFTLKVFLTCKDFIHDKIHSGYHKVTQPSLYLGVSPTMVCTFVVQPYSHLMPVETLKCDNHPNWGPLSIHWLNIS